MFFEWKWILDAFPSPPDIGPQTIIDTMMRTTNLMVAIVLEPSRLSLPADLDAKYRVHATIHRLFAYFTRLYGRMVESWTTIIAKENLAGLWTGIQDMFKENIGGDIWDWILDWGRWILWGWGTGIGCLLVLGLIIFWIRPDLFEPDCQQDLVESIQLEPLFSRDLRDSTGRAKSEFDSVSTSRTNTTNSTSTSTTSSSATTSASDFHRQVQVINPASISNPPPHIILARFICPDRSTWPPYYLQAFHRAEESVLQQNTIIGGHVDAPPSSGTRGNKDGCVGKIVLDKKKVKKDLKDGVIGFREGVTGLGNWEGIKWK